MVQPVPEFELEPQDEALAELLTNPAATGNRRNSAWNFVLELSRPKLGRHGLRNGNDDDVGYIEVQRSGAVVFKIPLERLENLDHEHQIQPYALLEFPVSVIRLAAKVLERWGPDASVVLVDFAFVGLRGWSLRRGSPQSPSGRFGPPPEFKEFDDLVPPKPFRFKREDLIEEPDRCGLRLITFVYEAFGHPAKDIPPELDPGTGTLVLPPG